MSMAQETFIQQKQKEIRSAAHDFINTFYSAIPEWQTRVSSTPCQSEKVEHFIPRRSSTCGTFGPIISLLLHSDDIYQHQFNATHIWQFITKIFTIFIRLSSVLCPERSGRERMDYNCSCNLIALGRKTEESHLLYSRTSNSVLFLPLKPPNHKGAF